MVTVTKRVEFDAAHRLYGYEGKCGHIHGHRYALEVTVEGTKRMDHLEGGMVIDFASLKEVMMGVVNKWDHALILNREDDVVRAVMDRVGHNLRIVRMDGNPTAENMAQEAFNTIKGALAIVAERVKVTRVRLYETPDSWADVEP